MQEQIEADLAAYRANLLVSEKQVACYQGAIQALEKLLCAIDPPAEAVADAKESP